MDQQNDQSVHRRIVKGRGIPRNHARIINSQSQAKVSEGTLYLNDHRELMSDCQAELQGPRLQATFLDCWWCSTRVKAAPIRLFDCDQRVVNERQKCACGGGTKRNVTSISMVTATGLPSEPTAGLNFHSFTVSTALFSNP